MDDDKDGRVSIVDFTGTVKNDPLTQKAFGPWLPSNTAGRGEFHQQFSRSQED